MNDSLKYTFLQAKLKIESYCAYQERCTSQVKQKLFSWRISEDDADALIAHLISHNFLNEERFAEAYVGGKFRIKHWGKIKIKQHLKAKKISDYSIKKAFLQIDPEIYFQTIIKLANSKSKMIKSKSTLDKKIKLTRFLQSKGFESDLIQDALKEM